MGKVDISIVPKTEIDPFFPTVFIAEWYHSTAQNMKFSIKEISIEEIQLAVSFRCV